MESKITDIHDIIGDFGRWQWEIYIPIIFMCLVNSMQTMMITFLAPKVDYTCLAPSFMNQSHTIFLKINESFGIARDFIENKTMEQSSCTITSQNISEVCTKWSFNSDDGRTIISEWDLVCDHEWLISFAKSVYMIGSLASLICTGQLSDWFGRYPMIIMSYVIKTVADFLSPLSTSYSMFAGLRFFSGFGGNGLYTTSFILFMELVGPKWRAHVGFGFQIAWSVGYILLPGLAWLLKDWTYLQWTLNAFNLLLAFICWVLPESPRWLLTHKKFEKFDQLLLNAAKKNKLPITEEKKKLLIEFRKPITVLAGKTKKSTIIDILKTSYLRYLLLTLVFVWITNAFVYYALSYNTNDLGGNPYMNFLFSGLVEFPAVPIFTYAVGKFGRVKTLSIGMITVGIFCVLLMFVPHDYLWLTITFAMLAKLFITGTYNVIYICTAEIFPTVVRHTALGYCSTFARLGPILAPFVRDLGRVTYSFIPDLLNAGLTVAAGLIVFVLPETKNKIIPDIFRDNKLEKMQSFETECDTPKQQFAEEHKECDVKVLNADKKEIFKDMV